MIIYKTTNIVNGKIYIGKDSKNSPTYLGSGTLLKRAIKRYGVENFKKEMLEECTVGTIDSREIYWINFYNSTNPEIGYNIALGGSGGDTFTTHPDKSSVREKLRQRPLISESQRKKRSVFLKENNPMSDPISKNKHAEAMKSRDYTGSEVLKRNNTTAAKCPHCGKEGSNSTTMKRWHFDNCKTLTGKVKHHPKIQCPHCNLEGQPSNMKRWHFDNCKVGPLR